MLLKVCGVWGASADRDIEMLAAADVDLVGLWHGVPGGEADLTTEEIVRLAAVARAASVEPVIVTFSSDADAFARVVRQSGAKWVQLHAYQLPNVVEELRAALKRRARVTIVKVLHVQGNRCVDLRLARAYERAGVDAFLLDATTPGRVGSTGEAIPADVAMNVAAKLNRPFFLAGGINAASRWRYRGLASNQGFVGIDVSTGARDGDGRLRLRRIEAINRAWRGGPAEELCLSPTRS